MRDINQKPSNTDKQIAMGNSVVPHTIASRRSVWLSYLQSKRAISTGGLSIFAVAALLGIKPAQANITDQPASLPNQTETEEQAIPTSSQSGELTPVGAGLAVIPEIENNGTNALPTPSQYNFAPSPIEKGNFYSRQPQPSTEDGTIAVPIANSLSNYSGTTSQNFNPIAIGTDFSKSTTVLPAFGRNSTESSPSLDAIESQETDVVESQVTEPSGTKTEQPTTIVPGFSPRTMAFNRAANAADYKVGFPESTKIEQPSTVLPGFSPEATAVSPTQDAVEYKVWDSSATGKHPKAILPPFALKANLSSPILNPVAPSVPQSVAQEPSPTKIAQATVATAATSEPYSGPGAARLLGGTIKAKSSLIAQTDPTNTSNESQFKDPLAPTLTFQGGFITQGETGARARLTGAYPVSPNLMFGGTVDLTTGEGFSDTAGTGLDITELYVTTSLPSYPNLRLTAGLVDLTSYFDRNSFAKDSLTHFFHPVFQTNPALARTGIGSRPAVLLNWDITDNFNARAAAFSSSRNLGELAVDGFAGELAYRFDNGIIRGTYASDRDDQRNGFQEIYGIPRSNGSFGPRTSDRESSYGINAEYYIPEIKMGLFGRYGHYQNTTIGRGGDTYSAGFNFLDLFMKDDRLGFGYGRDLSNSSLRRTAGNKRPDVWEVFYDFRLTSYLRAGVALQARDEFSEIVAGFRVKTEFDLLNLGRVFR